MSLGFAELGMLLGCLLCGLVLPVLLALLVVTSTKEWRAEHAGHEIVLQNSLLSEKLYVDGQVVDSHSGLTFDSRLRGRIEGEVAGHVVEARVRQGPLGLRVEGEITVDGVLLEAQRG